MPIICFEAEYVLAKRRRASRDHQAARKLVNSHLRLAAKIARSYRGYSPGCVNRALASLIGAARCRWKVIRSFIMESARRSSASAAASSSALGRSRRKVTLISTSIWAIPARSSAPTALRYSVSIRAWAHTKPIRQIVLTLTWTDWNAFGFMLAAANEVAAARFYVGVEWLC